MADVGMRTDPEVRQFSGVSSARDQKIATLQAASPRRKVILSSPPFPTRFKPIDNLKLISTKPLVSSLPRFKRSITMLWSARGQN
jgi:hypothetical protein